MKHVQVVGGGMPGPLAAESTKFTEYEFGKARAYALPGAEEYTETLDPRGWDRKGKTSKRRSERVTAAGGVELVVRSVRTGDDVVAESFAEEFPRPSASENVRKADFIHRNLRYEDGELVIRAERPLGYVRHADGREEEVYLAWEDILRQYRDVEPGEREQADRAWDRYREIKRDLNGFRFVDTDMIEKDDNVLFGTDGRGRAVVFKKDSEYTRVVDLGMLREDCERVEGMMRSVGFDPSAVEGRTVFKSIAGHGVAERLIDATTLMSPIQSQEMLSPQVAGELVMASWEHSRHDPAEFMQTLTTALSDAREIVPEQRCDFIRANTQAIRDAQGDGNELLRRRAGVKGFKRIRAVGTEKGDLLWG
ncbi:MAG: hypothetical protein GF416_08630 [Candidatus Altiarchaeales archaeon]|nr:hypothetical protein [Candidatus Altiarchaeales archaeon]MBD3417181.1 hypothetical protein [Candidatus Altiarchaeales archaeon]